MEFFLEGNDVYAEVRYKMKTTVIKLFIIVENKEVPVVNHNRLHVAKAVFSLKDFSMIHHTILFTLDDSVKDSIELTVLDLTFDERILNMLITCLEINKNRISLRYFNSFLQELKKIKKEIEGDEKNENC